MIKVIRRLLLLILASLTCVVLVGVENSYASEISAWSQTESLPYKLASHASFSLDNHLFIIGGSANTGESKFNVLMGSSITDGSISEWPTVSNLPTALIFHVAVGSGDRVYVLGGREENPGSELDHVNKVFVGQKDSSGIISSWQELESMPEARSLGGAVINGNRVYYAGGFDGSGKHDEIYSTTINEDGTLSPWSSTPIGHLPQAMDGFGMVSYGNKIVIFGGRTSDQPVGVVDKTFSAEIQSDGSLSEWEESSSMPEPQALFGYTLVGDTIITVGGNTSSSITDKVYSAKFNSDSTLGVWEESANVLPAPVGARPTLNYLNGHLYVVGGFDADGYSDKVYYASYTQEEEGINLDVPLFKQTDSAWGNQAYDGASYWSPDNANISAWGCALTSAAMVFKYHGVNKLPDSTSLDPGSLNTWLISQPDGYVRNGLVNWLALSRLSFLAKSQNGYSFDALEYSRTGSDTTLLNEELENDRPAILAEPGHFIVAKGVDGEGKFRINDPYYNRSSLSDYSDTFLSMGRFTPSNTDLSYIMLVVNENVNVKVTNSSNEEVGESFIQDPLDNDEGEGKSGEKLKIFYFQKPENGEYNVSLSASTSTNYQLDTYLYDEEGNVNKTSTSGILGPNSVDSFVISFNKENADDSEINRDIDFNVLIRDIKSLYKTRDIDKISYTTLLVQADLAKSFSRSRIMNKIAISTLKSMQKEIKQQKGKRVSVNAYNILNSDIDSLIANLEVGDNHSSPHNSNNGLISNLLNIFFR